MDKEKRIPIIIDTDMAADDWMATLYLLQSPRADVHAIALAATGEAHTRPGINTALRLLALADQVGIPVAAGRATPLQGNNTFPLSWRLAMDVRFFLRLPRTSQKRESVSAVDLLAQQLERATEPMTIVALGPLTNIGELLQARPNLKSKIERIMIMGGALNVRGNIEDVGSRIKNPHAEWNIFVDPHAANLVFQSGVPITLVPLDVTNNTPLTLAFLNKVVANAVTPAATFVGRVLQRLKPMISRDEVFFWDPLTAVLTTHPELGGYESCGIEVVEGDEAVDGRTIVSERNPAVNVCKTVSQAAFEELFLDTLNGR